VIEKRSGCQAIMLPRPRGALQASRARVRPQHVHWCRVLTLTCAGADRGAPDAWAERAEPPNAADPDRQRRKSRHPGLGGVPARAARPGRPHGVPVGLEMMLLPGLMMAVIARR